MKECPYCQKEFSDKGLSLHIWKAHSKQIVAKKQFEEQGARIEAEVHRQVAAKRQELAQQEERQRLSLELQQLANDIENEYKPLTICNICGGTWENHKEDCIFNTQKKGVFDEILDFATNMLTIFTGGH